MGTLTAGDCFGRDGPNSKGTHRRKELPMLLRHSISVVPDSFKNKQTLPAA